MSLTLVNKKTQSEMELGYGKFLILRYAVAGYCNKTVGKHYKKLLNNYYKYSGDAKQKFLDEYDKKTQSLIDDGTLDKDIAHFLYQSDCEGKLSCKQTKKLVSLLNKQDFILDDTLVKFRTFVNSCVKNGTGLEWY